MKVNDRLARRFYARDPETVAQDLLGRILVRRTGERLVAGRIVEAEAYGPRDPASHAFRGPTPRNATMFGPPGHAYVYVSHGIHHCLNATTGSGSAVLIRALEPLEGIGHMSRRRGVDDLRLLCAGPGRLCQALGITLAEDGADLTDGDGLWIAAGDPATEAAATPRIGLTLAADVPWRFVVPGSPYLSRPLSRKPRPR
jgi:DNA-3-methyladenine glycosylase